VTQREKCEKLRRFDKLDFISRGSEFEPGISLIQFKSEFLAITLLQYLTKNKLYVSIYFKSTKNNYAQKKWKSTDESIHENDSFSKWTCWSIKQRTVRSNIRVQSQKIIIL
jgi:hypothetical protein